MTNVLEIKRIKYTSGYQNQCATCSHEFEVGEIKTQWRLGLPTSNSYLRGQFWTIQCAECLERTKLDWIESLASI